MAQERWYQVRELFESVCHLEPEEREVRLAQACEDDPSLRTEVESLIAAHRDVPDVYESPAFKPVAELLHVDAPESWVGRQVGAYKLVRLIASGGMGTVFLAARADEQFEKNVAIKLINRGLATPEMRRRFLVERQTLAGLNHPNIARLLDGGITDDGLPYLVMDFVDGTPIDRYCDERKLTVAERLKLFRTVCSAVQYAHQHLIVHRDLKPANILVAAGGVPKLLDFGIAKVLDPVSRSDQGDRTATVHRVMTPEYASPEQIRGESITTASDIYSLGVILYRLLTGRRPYRFTSRIAHVMERIICEEEPLKPSAAITREAEAEKSTDPPGDALTPATVSQLRGARPDQLRRRLAGDLDTIVLMAMRKEYQRRYPSVQQFSEDIQRHLVGLPVTAQQATWRCRAGKFVRRNKRLVLMGTAAVLSLLAGTVGTAWQAHIASGERDKASQQAENASMERDRATEQARIADDERNKAEAARREAQISRRYAESMNAFLLGMFTSVRPGEGDRDVTVREILDKAAARLETGLEDEPLVEAALRTMIGNTYNRLDEHETAVTHLRASLAIYERVLGPEHAYVATSLNDLGVLFFARADYATAEPLLRRALPIYLREYGEEHTLTALCLNNLGAVCRGAGKPAEAISFYHRALAIQRKLHGNEHLAVAESLNNLAVVHNMTGELETAAELLREALDIRRKLLRPDNPRMADSMVNLAISLGKMGKYEESETLYRQALVIYRDSLGNDHSRVALNLENLGYLLHKKGDDASAERVLREAIEVWRRARPEGHWQIAFSGGVLGCCLTARGQYEEAEQLLLKAYEVVEETLNEQHPRTLKIADYLVELYQVLGKPEQANEWKAKASDADADEKPVLGEERK